MVCDVGAATADIALYVVTQVNPLQVEEVKHHPSISESTNRLWEIPGN